MDSGKSNLGCLGNGAFHDHYILFDDQRISERHNVAFSDGVQPATRAAADADRIPTDISHVQPNLARPDIPDVFYSWFICC